MIVHAVFANGAGTTVWSGMETLVIPLALVAAVLAGWVGWLRRRRP